MRQPLLLMLVALLVFAGCGDDPASPPPAFSGAPPTPAGFDVSFDIYSDASFTRLLRSVSLNSSWFQTTANYDAHDPNMPPGCTWRYQSLGTIGNDGMTLTSLDDSTVTIDIAVSYTPDCRTPTFIKVIQANQMSGGYRYDMRINGERVVHNLDTQQGLVFDVQRGAAVENAGAK